MREIKDIFLLNYRDNVKPFEIYIKKGTLWEGVHVPTSFTGLYILMCALALLFNDTKGIILFITTIVLIIQRYFMYQLFSKKIMFHVISLTLLVIYNFGLKPIYWIWIYIFPIIYWGKNNIKFAILELLGDFFFLVFIIQIIA